MRRRCSAGQDSRMSAGKPQVSGPNTNASPGANRGASWRVRPRVEIANQREGLSASMHSGREFQILTSTSSA